MSLRSELQELVEWIADTSANPAKPAPQALYRENWNDGTRNLEAATGKFEEVVASLREHKSPFVDFALDLQRESEALALRAQVLERRAPRRPRPPLADQLNEVEKRLADKQSQLDEVEKSLADKRKQHAQVRDPAPASERETLPKGPAKLVRSVSGTLETAHENLFDGVEHPDDVATAFQNRLELLAELTLSLRQLLEDDSQQRGGGQ